MDVTGEIRVVRVALSRLGLDDEVFAAAEIAGPLHIDGDRVEFADPMDRAAHTASIDPAQRRAVHRAFADVMLEHRHRMQRAEHLVAAAVGPDQDAADALGVLGDEATARGDSMLAGRLFERAGGLAPDVEQRARHLRHAGNGFWNAGNYTEAREAFDAAYVGSTDPLLRADIALQLGQLDMYQRGPRHARDLLVSDAEAVQAHDPDRAAFLLVHAASTATMSSDIVGALSLSRRACDLCEARGGWVAAPASLMYAYLSLAHGDANEFLSRFPALNEVADALKDSDVAEADLFLQLVGMLHVYTERWDTGRAYLTAVAHRAGRRSRTATAALAAATLSELCWRSGRWDEAWALATSDLVTEVTLTGARVWLLAFTAHLDAGFGNADDCRRRAQEALAEGGPMGLGTVEMWAESALGLLELGLGHPVAAAAHLDRVDALARAAEIIDPSSVWWQADHVEALIRSGRLHEATRALARFELGAAASPTRWGRATSARCRAMMATSDEAEALFAEALTHHEQLTAPFELARTLLCRAERRVATSSLLDPSGGLAEALAIFDSLGAASWSARASALRDSLGNGTEVGAGVDDVLTPSERRVAACVADGSTNREVAASLFISIKTVEFHLRNTYRKLGVRSRTELVRVLRR